jgi:hypothetical protein
MLWKYAYFSTFCATYITIFQTGRHIHDISNTYVSFTQLFAKGKSLKSEGIGMTWHGNCLIGPKLGHVEPMTEF